MSGGDDCGVGATAATGVPSLVSNAFDVEDPVEIAGGDEDVSLAAMVVTVQVLIYGRGLAAVHPSPFPFSPKSLRHANSLRNLRIHPYRNVEQDHHRWRTRECPAYYQLG